jgi:hypothetical protein
VGGELNVEQHCQPFEEALGRWERVTRSPILNGGAQDELRYSKGKVSGERSCIHKETQVSESLVNIFIPWPGARPPHLLRLGQGVKPCLRSIHHGSLVEVYEAHSTLFELA